jgi:hypothetical protein
VIVDAIAEMRSDSGFAGTIFCGGGAPSAQI